ncbi:MAG: hypothetical protein CMF25_04625 [Kangiellaceae bacterium]|nr:hypothetical protein [Kangiellaceae bacterium]|tara:strand:- start:868 stop:1323 length:456 start_codon:yes stop_codon:yes gene_type:complete
MTTKNEAALAALCHMTAAAGIGVTAMLFFQLALPFIGANLIGPGIIWLANKNKSDFIELHGREALNFQLTVLLASMSFIGLMVWLSRIAGDAHHLQALVFLIFGVLCMSVLASVLVTFLATLNAFRQKPFCYLARIPFIKPPAQKNRLSED